MPFSFTAELGDTGRKSASTAGLSFDFGSATNHATRPAVHSHAEAKRLDDTVDKENTCGPDTDRNASPINGTQSLDSLAKSTESAKPKAFNISATEQCEQNPPQTTTSIVRSPGTATLAMPLKPGWKRTWDPDLARYCFFTDSGARTYDEMEAVDASDVSAILKRRRIAVENERSARKKQQRQREEQALKLEDQATKRRRLEDEKAKARAAAKALERKRLADARAIEKAEEERAAQEKAGQEPRRTKSSFL
eukprot:SAG31_NODE_12074_length_971_cov_0.840596_1_plen_250_part_01